MYVLCYPVYGTVTKGGRGPIGHRLVDLLFLENSILGEGTRPHARVGGASPYTHVGGEYRGTTYMASPALLLRRLGRGAFS